MPHSGFKPPGVPTVPPNNTFDTMRAAVKGCAIDPACTHFAWDINDKIYTLYSGALLDPDGYTLFDERDDDVVVYTKGRMGARFRTKTPAAQLAQSKIIPPDYVSDITSTRLDFPTIYKGTCPVIGFYKNKRIGNGKVPLNISPVRRTSVKFRVGGWVSPTSIVFHHRT